MKKNSGFYSAAVLENVFARKNCIVQVEIGSSLGTGFVVSYDKALEIVPNNHILPSCQSATEASVTRRDTTVAKAIRSEGWAWISTKRAFSQVVLLTAPSSRCGMLHRDCSLLGWRNPQPCPRLVNLFLLWVTLTGRCFLSLMDQTQSSPSRVQECAMLHRHFLAARVRRCSTKKGELIAVHSRAGDRVWHRDSYKFSIAFDMGRIIDWFEIEVRARGDQPESDDALVDSISEN